MTAKKIGIPTGGGTRVEAVPRSETTAGPELVDLEPFADAEVFFG